MQNELYHHGVKGQRWGVRRYQNKDGSLTPAGRQKLDKWKEKEYAKSDKRYGVERYRSAADKSLAKFDEVRRNKHSTEGQINKSANRAMKKITRAYVAEGYAAIEKSAISKKNLSDINKEKVATGMTIAATFAASMVMPPVVVGGIAGGTMAVQQQHRRGITKESTKDIHKNASEKAYRDIQNR